MSYDVICQQVTRDIVLDSEAEVLVKYDCTIIILTCLDFKNWSYNIAAIAPFE